MNQSILFLISTFIIHIHCQDETNNISPIIRTFQGRNIKYETSHINDNAVPKVDVESSPEYSDKTKESPEQYISKSSQYEKKDMQEDYILSASKWKIKINAITNRIFDELVREKMNKRISNSETTSESVYKKDMSAVATDLIRYLLKSRSYVLRNIRLLPTLKKAQYYVPNKIISIENQTTADGKGSEMVILTFRLNETKEEVTRKTDNNNLYDMKEFGGFESFHSQNMNDKIIKSDKNNKKNRNDVVNALIDSILEVTTSIIDEIEIPDIDMTVVKNVMQFKGTQGTLSNLKTLKRRGDSDMVVEDKVIKMSMKLGFDVLSVVFKKYYLTFIALTVSGEVEMDIKQNEFDIEIALNFTNNKCAVDLLKFELVKFDDITIRVSCPIMLRWVVNKFVNLVTNTQKDRIKNIIENRARELMQSNLKKYEEKICKIFPPTEGSRGNKEMTST